MKNLLFLVAITVIFCAVSSCDESQNCDNSASVNAVMPNSNPAGYEVLLITDGFTAAAKVVFGTVEADSRAGGETGEIIARVPAGLSGTVEISVEEGDCIARWAGFSVLGALPGNNQPSLPDIIIPTPPTTLPTGGIENNWANAASIQTSRNYGIHLVGTISGGVTQLDNSFEYHFDFNSPLADNPVKGNINTNTNVVYLEIDRTAKGGTVEKFDGQFIARPVFLPATDKWPILLVSRETGRQLLISFAL